MFDTKTSKLVSPSHNTYYILLSFGCSLIADKREQAAATNAYRKDLANIFSKGSYPAAYKLLDQYQTWLPHMNHRQKEIKKSEAYMYSTPEE